MNRDGETVSYSEMPLLVRARGRERKRERERETETETETVAETWAHNLSDVHPPAQRIVLGVHDIRLLILVQHPLTPLRAPRLLDGVIG